MSASFVSFSILLWILFAQMTSPSDEGPFITPGQPEVHLTAAIHDHGGLFGEGARRLAHAALRRIQRDRQVPVVVETFKSLRGRTIDEVARRRPRPLSDDGIYILVVGLERDVAVQVFRHVPHGGPSGQGPAAIREAFLGPLRAGDADAALDQGIRAIESSVGSQSEAGRDRFVSASILVGILAVLFAIRRRGRHRGRRRGRRSSRAGTRLTGDPGPHGHRLGLPHRHPPRTGDELAAPLPEQFASIQSGRQEASTIMATFGSLSVVPWILFAQSSWNMDVVPVITAAQPSSEVTAEVRDGARLFSRGTKRRARIALGHIHRKYEIPVHLETVKSLDGAWIADVAGQRARAAAPERLYILLAGRERDVGVIAARHGPASRVSNQDRESIRRAFLGPLKAGQADGALEQGIQAIGTTLAAASASRSKVSGRDVLLSSMLIVTGLALLLVSQTWAWYGDRSRQRRGNAAGAHVIGQAKDSLWASRTASRVAPTTSANDIGEPCCAARSSVRRHEPAEA